jgi:uncharacterized membrane protein
VIRNWLLPLFAGLIVAAIAWQGTIAATPYALMSAAMHKIGQGGGVNQFRFAELATPDNQPIVRPSPDLLYSSCVFDVSEGPVLIDVEPVPDAYWSVSIFDARTDVAKVVSVREQGDKPARLVLHNQDMQLEMVPDYDPVALKYDKGIALIRILLNDPSKYAEIDAIRRKSRCTPG